MRSSRTSLVFFAAATTLLLFNYPWLSLFSSQHLLFGIPPLVLYLFGLWFGFILIVRLIIHPSHDEPDDEPDSSPKGKRDA